MIITVSEVCPAETAVTMERLAAVAAAGFDGIELLLTANLLTAGNLAERLTEVARQVRAHGLLMSGVRLPAAPAASTDVARISQAIALGSAAAAPLVVMPFEGTPSPPNNHADVVAATLEALMNLRFEAEDQGVTLALWDPAARLLATPPLTADFIDAVNSFAVGYCLDMIDATAHGDLTDWITTLAGRLACVCVADRPAATSFNAPAIVSALRDCQYDGPLTVCDVASLADAAQRWRRLLLDGGAVRPEGRP